MCVCVCVCALQYMYLNAGQNYGEKHNQLVTITVSSTFLQMYARTCSFDVEREKKKKTKQQHHTQFKVQ